jgi:hypothetical protein
MKRRTVWLIMILEFFVVIGGGLAVKYLPGAVVYWRSSEVYKRYCEVEGIRASYVKDYPVNDTLTVAVTLLEATDSAGWERLMERFGAPDDMIETVKSNPEARKAWVRMAPKGHPEEMVEGGMQGGDTEEWGYDMVAISFEPRAIAVFDVKSKEDFIALFYYNSDYMTNRTNQFIKKWN